MTTTTRQIDFGFVDLDDARLIRTALDALMTSLERPDAGERGRAELQRAGVFRSWVDARIRIEERPTPAGEPENPCDGPPGAPAGHATYRARRARHGSLWRRRARGFVDPDPPRLPAPGELDELRAARPTTSSDGWRAIEEGRRLAAELAAGGFDPTPAEVEQAARDAFVGSARADGAEPVEVEIHAADELGAPCFHCAAAPALPGRLLCAACTEGLAREIDR